jgi:hypothetical protein
MIERSYRRVVRVAEGPTAAGAPAGAITGLGPAAVASFKGFVEAGRRELRGSLHLSEPEGRPNQRPNACAHWRSAQCRQAPISVQGIQVTDASVHLVRKHNMPKIKPQR